MFEKAQAEHEWLQQLLGHWISEGECVTGPGQEPQKNIGRMNCRSLGTLWVICEGEGGDDTPEGKWSSIMTIGFDARQKRFVGTFIGSMMTHLWQYSGVLDSSGKKLPLDCEGPGFDGRETARYRDSIEMVSPDHWIFTGEIQSNDGVWQTIMTTHNRRA